MTAFNRRGRALVIALIVWVAASSQAFAWHQGGHKLTALIAFERLSDAKKTELVDILRSHPRFEDDFDDRMPEDLSPDDQARWIFCQASIWPDLVRRQGGDGQIPAIPGLRTSYHRENWHFINHPYILLPKGSSKTLQDSLEAKAKGRLNLDTTAPNKETLDMNAVQAFDYNLRVLRTSTNKGARAVALCWVLHLAGDLHQPLHAVGLFTQTLFSPSKYREGDRGGNSITYGKGDGENLHSLWDDAPGPNSHFASINAVKSGRQDLLNKLPSIGPAAIAGSTTAADWANESFDLAKRSVYTKAIRHDILDFEARGASTKTEAIVDLPDHYRESAATLSAKRVVQGGFRLGEALK